MRILMWFSIGFAIACAIGSYVGPFFWIAIAAFALAALLFFFKKKPSTIVAIMLLGLSVGMLWFCGYHYLYLNAAKEYDGKTIDITVTACDYSYETDYGVAADGKIYISGKEYSIRLYLNEKCLLKPGDRIDGRIRLRMTTNDSAQGQTYHQGEGKFLLGYVQEEAVITPSEEIPIRFFPAQLRHAIQELLQQAFPSDTIGFANALFLGDSSRLDYETDTDFKLSGIRHIIAVSGLHISILMSVVLLLCGRNRYVSAVIGIPLLVLFASIVGFTPSVMRSCIMQILMLIGLVLNKEYDPPTSLAFAGLAMLIVNPITIVSVSFQLSVGCLIGIFLLFERLNGFFVHLLRIPKGKSLLTRIFRWIASSSSITISTFVITTPLSAIYFGTISIVGVLTNLLTLWVVSFIFCGIAVVILAGLIWQPLASAIALIVSIPMRYVLVVARVLADIPVAAVYTNSIYIVIWLVACYCLIAGTIFLKRKYPLVMVGCVSILLVLAIAASWLEPKLDNYRVTVFDVGEGQSILVQYAGRCYLIDCGGDSEQIAADTVSHSLLSQGIKHLDGIIVTHYDKDHAGGIPNLLTSISVSTLYLPDVKDELGLRNVLSQINCEIEWVSDITKIRYSDMLFTMIPGEHETSDNERSMCILCQIENYDILVTGDRSTTGEKALLKKVSLPEVDVLVVGHHGSATSTSLELLEKVKPDVAVISVGKGNYFGHPADDLLYRLRLFECSILRTDRDGTIVLRG